MKPVVCFYRNAIFEGHKQIHVKIIKKKTKPKFGTSPITVP